MYYLLNISTHPQNYQISQLYLPICRDGGIQRITKLFSSEYLLGPGPDKVSLTDIILDQYEKYTESKKQVVAEQQRNQELGQMIAENNQSNIIVNQTASQK